jgi:hypothetical protein
VPLVAKGDMADFMLVYQRQDLAAASDLDL